MLDCGIMPVAAIQVIKSNRKAAGTGSPDLGGGWAEKGAMIPVDEHHSQGTGDVCPDLGGADYILELPQATR